jgi:hypothetical protein
MGAPAKKDKAIKPNCDHVPREFIQLVDTVSRGSLTSNTSILDRIANQYSMRSSGL